MSPLSSLYHHMLYFLSVRQLSFSAMPYHSSLPASIQEPFCQHVRSLTILSTWQVYSLAHYSNLKDLDLTTWQPQALDHYNVISFLQSFRTYLALSLSKVHSSLIPMHIVDIALKIPTEHCLCWYSDPFLTFQQQPHLQLHLRVVNPSTPSSFRLLNFLPSNIRTHY